MPRNLLRSLTCLAVALAAASCATHGTATGTASASDAAPREYEPWPPAEVVARPASVSMAVADGKTITLQPKEGGWKIDELFEMVSRTMNRSFLYDSANATFKQAKIEFVGSHVIRESQLFEWLQAVLSYRKLVLVPVGPKSPDGKQMWFVMDQADPNMKSRPVYIDESEVFDYAERDGLYVVTTLRVRDTVDTTRIRNALSPLSTATAGIGRIQDIPGARAVIVSDFAPTVAAMKRMLDRINADTDRPAPLPQPPAAPKAEK